MYTDQTVERFTGDFILQERGGWVSVLFIYIGIKFFHCFVSAVTGVAAPGCSGTVNAAD